MLVRKVWVAGMNFWDFCPSRTLFFCALNTSPSRRDWGIMTA